MHNYYEIAIAKSCCKRQYLSHVARNRIAIASALIYGYDSPPLLSIRYIKEIVNRST